ncbi:ArsR family transcriptional regulator [Aeromicrobium sp. Root344]|uniref:metalloregulator ArsR/SmtB family transcription factor n=1 Tax=Aeromicrobium sp. Root344 TaxID=1736521 RepID=UPI000700D781|nr:metalloregulator ArsR/SmtB family transcription factor [Aeromicrobium sp. Root344]KQV76556.1 ArsR family transcriptional regulator [Aeromicrobium sp. Root344]
MEALFTALADPARWRLVTLLAERPRPVGVLAQLAGARQPQTTKHLQTLERAGIVTSQRSGQRRIYALQSAPLRELAAALQELAGAAEQADSRVTFDQYGLSLQAERPAADQGGWADGRTFSFTRALAASPQDAWPYLTETSLLSQWWTPQDLRVSELVFDARPGGDIVQEYRDVEDTSGVDVVVGRAEGVVDAVQPCEHLAYRLSPQLPDGGTAFTAHVGLTLRPTASGAELDLELRVTDSATDAADFIAGIEIGFGQSLDRLVSVIAAEPHATNSDTPHDNDTRSTT